VSSRSRPLSVRGVRRAYSTWPLWLRRVIALVYTVAGAFMWWTTGLSVSRTITGRHPRSILVLVMLLFIAMWLTQQAARAWRRTRKPR
jgi:hypothetical protein